MLNTVASIKTPTSTVEVLRADWPRPIELTWHDPHAVVTLLFRPADYEIEGRYQDGGMARRLDRIGKVFFVPPNAELYGWGTGGEIKAVRCLFEPGFYERTVGSQSKLTAAQLRRTLDLGGTLLPTLLTRLMEEALSPGLASVALAEALGTAVLIECGRLVSDDRTQVWVCQGRLFGACPPTIAGLIEARGLGVIGATPLRLAEIRLLVLCEPADAPVERMPEPETLTVFDVALPVLRIHALEASAPVKLREALSHIGAEPQGAYQAAAATADAGGDPGER